MEFTSKAETYDVVVIGAGISGLAMARFYLEIHPACRLLILERDHCVGGTWNSARSYDHFWAQWAHPYAEFSDLSMEEPPPEDTYYGFFRAIHTTRYLDRYADHHNFAGLSLRDRISFGVTVRSVTKTNDKAWRIQGVNVEKSEQVEIHASKLVIASGLTSVAKFPVITGSESFGAPIIHTLDFARSEVLSADNSVKHITVIGGGKSAGDMAYAAVKAGKSVSWIVRPGGHGPSFYTPVEGRGPYRGIFDLGSSRITEIVNPSIWSPNNMFVGALHRTKRGVDLIGKIFAGADQEMFQVANYKGRESKGGFDKLQPHTGIFWNNGPGGLLNRKDFWEVIASNVDIHYEYISYLSEKKIHLQNGQELNTDALLCGTGWELSYGYLSDALAAEMGLPYSPAASPETTKSWVELDAKADQEIVIQLPILANSPPHFHSKPSTEPFRLYNGIVPARTDDRNLVVIGQVEVVNYFRATECQAMWATAYLDGHLQLPSVEERDAEVAQHVAFARRRYLSNGELGNNFSYNTLQYCDRLLAELGLFSHRGFWLKDLFYPCEPKGMRGLKDEYVKRFGDDRQLEEGRNIRTANGKSKAKGE